MKKHNILYSLAMAATLALPCSAAAQSVNLYEETIKITDPFKQACKVYKIHPTLHNGNLLIELGGKYGLIDFDGNIKAACDFDKIISSPKGIVGISDKVCYTFDEYANYINNVDNIICDSEGTFYIYRSGKAIGKIDINDYGVLEPYNEFGQGEESQEPAGEEFVNEETGKTGFVDMSGKEIIPAMYDEVRHCDGDIYCVMLNNMYGLVKAGGEILIPLEYESLSYLTDVIEVRKNGKSGYIDINGKIIIPIEYDFISTSYEGVLTAEKNGKRMLIDKSGRCITKHLYDELYNSNPEDFINFGRTFHNGLQYAKREGKAGCVNKHGEEVIPCTHEMLSDLFSIVIAATKGGKTAFYDYTGRQLTSYKYDDYVLFYDGYSIVKENGKYGCLYPNGTEFIPCKYDAIRYAGEIREQWNSLFVGNSVAVEKDGKTGFCDITGKEVIAPTYDRLPEELSDENTVNYIIVKKEGKYGVVRNGVEIVPCSYEEIPEEILAEIDKNANESAKPTNKIYKPTADDCFSVIEKRGKYGITNRDGKRIIPCKCDDIVITPLVGGVIHAEIAIDGRKHDGFIDSYGNHTFAEYLF